MQTATQLREDDPSLLRNRLTLLISDDMKRALKIRAAQENREMSEIVRDLIGSYLASFGE